MKVLPTIIILLSSIVGLRAQSSYKLGLEIGGDFIQSASSYSLYNNVYESSGAIIREITQDHPDKGGSVFVNNQITLKNHVFNADVGLSYLSYERFYSVGINEDTILNYSNTNHTFYWRLRVSYSYKFNLKSGNKISIGIGVGGQDLIRDFNNKESRVFRDNIGVFPEEWFFESEELRRGSFTFTPFAKLALEIPMKKNSIELKYCFYLGAFTDYDSSVYYETEGGQNLKYITPNHVGRHNHSISIAFNLNLVDNL